MEHSIFIRNKTEDVRAIFEILMKKWGHWSENQNFISNRIGKRKKITEIMILATLNHVNFPNAQ